MIPEQELLTKIQVVLVETSQPGNIGSVARAMKTMGCRRLVLVSPKRFPHPEAEWMAAGAVDLLASASVVASLEEAVAKSQWVVGTSARARTIGPPLLPLRSGISTIGQHLQAGALEVSLVFGAERTGLENHHLKLCQQLLWIPTSVDYTSLNLSHAVQIVLYELGQSITPPLSGDSAVSLKPLASSQELEGLFAHFEQALIQSGYLDPTNPRHLMERLRALFARSTLTKSEIDLLRGILRAWQK